MVLPAPSLASLTYWVVAMYEMTVCFRVCLTPPLCNFFVIYFRTHFYQNSLPTEIGILYVSSTLAVRIMTSNFRYGLRDISISVGKSRKMANYL